MLRQHNIRFGRRRLYGRLIKRNPGSSLPPAGGRKGDVVDRVPVELITADVEPGFIDFAQPGRRQNPDSSVLPPQL